MVKMMSAHLRASILPSNLCLVWLVPMRQSRFSVYCRVPGDEEVLAIGQSDGMLALHATGAEALEEPRALGIAPASIAFSARGMPTSSDHHLEHAQSVKSRCTLQGLSAWAEVHSFHTHGPV